MNSVRIRLSMACQARPSGLDTRGGDVGSSRRWSLWRWVSSRQEARSTRGEVRAGAAASLEVAVEAVVVVAAAVAGVEVAAGCPLATWSAPGW